MIISLYIVVTASITESAIEVTESDGSVSVCVSLDQLPIQTIVSVTMSTIAGSATGNQSHTLTSL